jgi:hypothetical protein
VAVVARHALSRCEGFRVESPPGFHGWVEETWLGAADEPAALAVRMVDGRDGLLLAEDVETLDRDRRLLAMRPDARLLELDPPRIDTESANGISASWRTTGELSELPVSRGVFERVLIALGRRRLVPPPPRPEPDRDRPTWLTLLLLFSTIALIVGVLIGLDFLIAWLATGSAT